MPHAERLADDLYLIDTHYRGTPEAIGAFLLTGERPALIETGPASTLRALLEGIRAAGLDPQDLQAVAVTHIHLDHAGAAGALVAQVPHLDVYVHPVGAPHLIDPARLVASAGRLYGADLERLLGVPLPAPPERVHALNDGDTVRLGSRRLVAVDTPGHARHHLAFHDEASGDLFTGDAAGVALPGSRYVRPPTPPPELDIPAWEDTIRRLQALGARRLLLTHFGVHGWAGVLLAQLRDRLHATADLVRAALDGGADDESIVDRMHEAMAAEAARLDGPDAASRLEVMMSTRLSTLGLIRYLKRR